MFSRQYFRAGGAVCIVYIPPVSAGSQAGRGKAGGECRESALVTIHAAGVTVCRSHVLPLASPEPQDVVTTPARHK